MQSYAIEIQKQVGNIFFLGGGEDDGFHTMLNWSHLLATDLGAVVMVCSKCSNLNSIHIAVKIHTHTPK